MCLQVRNVYVKKWCPYIDIKDTFILKTALILSTLFQLNILNFRAINVAAVKSKAIHPFKRQKQHVKITSTANVLMTTDVMVINGLSKQLLPMQHQDCAHGIRVK